MAARALARLREGELAGKTVFVPLTLPGELVEAHIVEDKRSFINAEVDSIIEASPQRTTPRCPYFGSCGGCSYQHGDYAHQVEIKKQILREALDRAHLPSPPDIAAVSRHEWNYRNRVRLQVQTSPFGLGYRERRSNKLLAVDSCPIAAPLLETAIAAITERGASLRLAEYCGEIELFTADEGALLLSFFADKRDRLGESKFAEICAALKENLPELQGGGAVSSPRQTARHACFKAGARSRSSARRLALNIE